MSTEDWAVSYSLIKRLDSVDLTKGHQFILSENKKHIRIALLDQKKVQLLPHSASNNDRSDASAFSLAEPTVWSKDN